MEAGRLRHRGDIEFDAGEAQDTAGQPIEDWQPFAISVPMEIEPLRGNELIRAKQLNALLTTRIKMRYLTGLNETMRVVHEGVKYNITEIIDVDMRHFEIHLICESGLLDNQPN